MSDTTQVFRAIRRLRAGTATVFNRPHGIKLFVRLELAERDGKQFWRVVLHDGKAVFELWESTSLQTLRKIGCGYYPEMAKFFGPARLCVGF